MENLSPQGRIRAARAQHEQHGDVLNQNLGNKVNAALDEVYEAFEKLKTKSKPEVDIEVLEEATITERSIRHFRLGKVLGEKAVNRTPFTISEYMEGQNDHSTRQRKLRVAERIPGWLIPRVIIDEPPKKYDKAGNDITYYPPLPVYKSDPSVPNTAGVSLLAMADDNRSWDKTHISCDTEYTTVGVFDGFRTGSQALRAYSEKDLMGIAETIEYMAENIVYPIPAESP